MQQKNKLKVCMKSFFFLLMSMKSFDGFESDVCIKSLYRYEK